MARKPSNALYTWDDTHNLLREADLKASEHQFAQALSLYDKAIASNSKDPSAYSARGYIYKRDFRDFPAAIFDYTKAIELSKAALKTENIIKVNGHLIGRITDTSAEYFRRAIAYAEDAQYEKALGDINTAITLDKESCYCYARRADIYSRMGQHDKAIVDFDAALKKLGRYGDSYNGAAVIYFLRGDAFQRAGQFKQALKDYDFVVELVSEDPRGYIRRASMYEHFGDHKKALADYAQAEKCLEQYAPKHRLGRVLSWIPEWKERMAQSLYEGRARVYDALHEKKLADADRVSAKAQVVTIK